MPGTFLPDAWAQTWDGARRVKEPRTPEQMARLADLTNQASAKLKTEKAKFDTTAWTPEMLDDWLGRVARDEASEMLTQEEFDSDDGLADLAYEACRIAQVLRWPILASGMGVNVLEQIAADLADWPKQTPETGQAMEMLDYAIKRARWLADAADREAREAALGKLAALPTRVLLEVARLTDKDLKAAFLGLAWQNDATDDNPGYVIERALFTPDGKMEDNELWISQALHPRLVATLDPLTFKVEDDGEEDEDDE